MNNIQPSTRIDNLEFVDNEYIQIARNTDYGGLITNTLVSDVQQFCNDFVGQLWIENDGATGRNYDGKFFESKIDLREHIYHRYSDRFDLQKVLDGRAVFWFKLESNEGTFFLKITEDHESAFEQHLGTHVTQMAWFPVIEPIYAQKLPTQDFSRNLQTYIPQLMDIERRWHHEDPESVIKKVQSLNKASVIWHSYYNSLRNQIHQTGHQVNEFLRTHPDYSKIFNNHEVRDFETRNAYIPPEGEIVYFDVQLENI